MDYKTAKRTARKRAIDSRRKRTVFINGIEQLQAGQVYYVIHDEHYKHNYGVDPHPTAWNRRTNIVVGYFDPTGNYHLAPWWDEGTGWITGPVVCNSVWW